jgi:hypothetical protein
MDEPCRVLRRRAASTRLIPLVHSQCAEGTYKDNLPGITVVDVETKKKNK